MTGSALPCTYPRPRQTTNRTSLGVAASSRNGPEDETLLGSHHQSSETECENRAFLKLKDIKHIIVIIIIIITVSRHTGHTGHTGHTSSSVNTVTDSLTSLSQVTDTNTIVSIGYTGTCHAHWHLPRPLAPATPTGTALGLASVQSIRSEENGRVRTLNHQVVLYYYTYIHVIRVGDRVWTCRQLTKYC